MTFRQVVLLTFSMLFTMAPGCARKSVEHTVRKVPAEAADEPQQAKVEFEAMLKGKLEKLEEEIEELKRKAVSLQDTAMAKWTEEVAELDAKQKAARRKFDEATRASGAAWQHLRDGATSAWEQLEAAVRKARSEFD